MKNRMNVWISTAVLIDDIIELAEQIQFTDGHIMFSWIFILYISVGMELITCYLVLTG